MSKFNYFNSIEEISVLCSRAVFLCCSPNEPTHIKEFTSIIHSANDKICDVEQILFCDFMPPLERNSIAQCVHSLEAVFSRSVDIMSYRRTENYDIERQNREAELCVSMMRYIEKDIPLLRRLKKSTEKPHFKEFRSLIFQALEAHAAHQKKYAANTSSPRSQKIQELIGALRRELTQCFNTITEVILSNI